MGSCRDARGGRCPFVAQGRHRRLRPPIYVSLLRERLISVVMSVSVASTEVLTYKRASTARIVAMINLLRVVWAKISTSNSLTQAWKDITIQLVAVKMFCTRIVSSATWVSAFEAASRFCSTSASLLRSFFWKWPRVFLGSQGASVERTER